MRKSKVCVISTLALVILTSGCATVIEGTKGVLGVSTKILEEGRKDAITKTYNYSYDECRQKVIARLARYGCYIYARDEKEKMLAIYISETDTTPVGIFFKVVDSEHTQIQVSSPSTFGKELIAARIAKAFAPEKEKGKSDAEEDTDK